MGKNDMKLFFFLYPYTKWFTKIFVFKQKCHLATVALA